MSWDLGGGSDFFQVADGTSIDITGTELTLAAWVHLDNNVSQGIFGKWSDPNRQYLINIDAASKILGAFGDGGASGVFPTSATVFTTGAWHHLVARLTSGDSDVYLDGVTDGDAAGITLGDTANPLNLGACDGRLAEMAVWNFSLSDAEILALAKGTPPGLIRRANLKGWWRMWGIGTTEGDASGNGANGAKNGTPVQGNHSPVSSPILF